MGWFSSSPISAPYRVNSGIIAHPGRNRIQLTLVVALVAIWVQKYWVETFHDITTIKYVRWWWRHIKQQQRHIPFNYLHAICSVSRMLRYTYWYCWPIWRTVLGHGGIEQFPWFFMKSTTTENMCVYYADYGVDLILSFLRRKTFIWASVGLLSLRPLGTYFWEIWIKIQHFS